MGVFFVSFCTSKKIPAGGTNQLKSRYRVACRYCGTDGSFKQFERPINSNLNIYTIKQGAHLLLRSLRFFLYFISSPVALALR